MQVIARQLRNDVPVSRWILPRQEPQPATHGPPADLSQREASFSQAPRRAEQHIPGARVNVQLFNALRLLHGREDAVTCAFVPAVGQAGHLARVIPQHRQHLLPGRGQVMDIPRQHLRYPHRQAVRVEQALDVPAEILFLPRVPQVDFPALPADGFLVAPAGGDDLAVQDHVRRPFLHGAFQGLFQAGRLRGHDLGALGYVAVRRRLRQTEPRPQPGDVRFIPVPGQDEQRLPVTARAGPHHERRFMCGHTAGQGRSVQPAGLVR